MFKLDLVTTVAFAGAVVFVGYGIRRMVPVLARYNIPAPVIGGLLAALVTMAARQAGWAPPQFDTALQSPLMVAFFTTIGFGASLGLLRVGGPQVMLFFGIATAFAVLQNLVGILVALPLGADPLLGVLAGSVTLTGGPATGLAFAPLFEEAGVEGASTLAIAAAMVGIVFGGIVGTPVATRIIERAGLRGAQGRPGELPTVAAQVVEQHLPDAPVAAPSGEDEESYQLTKNLVTILIAMWIGSGVSAWTASMGLTLPSYIGAMLVAAVIRNVDDHTGWIGLSQRTLDDLGNVALTLFIAMALMTLKLWEIASLALPLVAILCAQIALVAVSLRFVYDRMGRDYEAAVMAGGFCGFMLGTTANAMANMRSLVERYGPAPRAFLVVPMVGAFFIDFTNAIIVTLFVNFLR